MWHCSRQEEERRRQELEAKRHEDLLRRQQQQHQQFKMAEEDPFVSSFVCTNFFVIKSLCAATTYVTFHHKISHKSNFSENEFFTQPNTVMNELSETEKIIKIFQV